MMLEVFLNIAVQKKSLLIRRKTHVLESVLSQITGSRLANLFEKDFTTDVLTGI